MDITRENILAELHDRKTRMNNDSLRVKALQQMLNNLENEATQERLRRLQTEAVDNCTPWGNHWDVLREYTRLLIVQGLLKNG